LTGESDHCLLSKEGKIIPLNDPRVAALSAKIREYIVSNEEEI